MRDTLHAFLLAVATLTGFVIVVVGVAMLPDGLAVGLSLSVFVGAWTHMFRSDLKRLRECRERAAAAKLAADNARSR